LIYLQLDCENDFYLTKDVCVGIKRRYNLKVKPAEGGT